MEYGKNFKKARLKKGYSRARLEIKSGVKSETIRAFEEGKTNARLATAVAIAKALNISIDEMVGINK